MVTVWQISHHFLFATSKGMNGAAVRAGRKAGLQFSDVRCYVIRIIRDSDGNQFKSFTEPDRWDTLHSIIMTYPAFCALLYLLEVTHSVQPVQVVSESFPRSFARWSREERLLVQTLMTAKFSAMEIGHVVGRSDDAIRRQLQQMEGRLPQWGSLPKSPIPLQQEDLDLLTTWNVTPPRDPLAWRFGQPSSPEWLQHAERPTLRVITVQSDPELNLSGSGKLGMNSQVASQQDNVNAARATWIDLAVQLIKQGGTVLCFGPDPHQARHLAIRAALQRHSGQRMRRQAVTTMNAFGTWEGGWEGFLEKNQLVLLDAPEKWPPQQLPDVGAQTVIVVLPTLTCPEVQTSTSLKTSGEAVAQPDSTSLPFLLRERAVHWSVQANYDFQRQEEAIKYWARNRQLERFSAIGIPNSTGTEARLDWPALQWLPPSGTVLASREDLVLRAYAWYCLVTQRKGKIDEEIQGKRLKWMVPFEAHGHPIQQAAQKLHKNLNAQGVELNQRVMARTMLDVIYSSCTEHCELRFTLGDTSGMGYIGR